MNFSEPSLFTYDQVYRDLSALQLNPGGPQSIEVFMGAIDFARIWNYETTYQSIFLTLDACLRSAFHKQNFRIVVDCNREMGFWPRTESRSPIYATTPEIVTPSSDIWVTLITSDLIRSAPTQPAIGPYQIQKT